ncbi:hypothetical protein [Reinekea sp.]|jgi:hypothetical protein|uniref:hypothetical protein n=1 Tax=Reinekea sp. TaxID=1970455 RepID=UPI002A814895|nr:hypothetical protein [Reinekea sp.]
MKLKRLALGLLLASAIDSFAEDLKPAAWIALPAVGSSPETGFQYGAYVMRIFPQKEPQIRQNRLEILIQGTTQGQYQAYLWPNVYVAHGRWNISGKLGGQYWPSDYYGQANRTPDEGDSYVDSAVESSISATRKLTDTLYLGASLLSEWHSIENRLDLTEPQLLDAKVTGQSGGRYIGLGLSAQIDTRDNADWSRSGHLLASRLELYSESMGSDLDFYLTELSAARFIAIGPDVLAMRVHSQLASAYTPFTHLPRPTGDGTLRAANGNRWIDFSALGGQLEYRKTLGQKWAAVAFFDTTQVAPSLTELQLTQFHYSIGSGVRFATTPDRFNIRLDLGWVDGQDLNFAISVGEAF